MVEKMKPVAWRWKKPSTDSAGNMIAYSPWITRNRPDFLPWWPNEALFTADQLAQARREGIEQCAKVLENQANELEKKAKPHYGLPYQLRQSAAAIRALPDEEV